MKEKQSITILKSGWMALALILLTTTLAFTNWYYYSKTKRYLDGEFTGKLETLALLASREVSGLERMEFTEQPSPATFQRDTLEAVLSSMADMFNISNIQIVREDGIILFSLKPGIFPPGEEYPHWNMDYLSIITALEGKPASTPLFRAPDGSYLKAGYAPLPYGAKPVVALVSIEASAVFLSHLNDLRNILLATTILSILAVALFTWFAVKATSSLVRARESLMRSETLASMGRMAAGIAHEIRNPLFIIRSSAETLKNNHPESAKQFDEYIIEEVDRLNGIVSDYLLFARDEPAEKKSMDLLITLNRSTRLLEEHFNERGIELKKRFLVDEAPFDGEEKRLQQAFLNILLNAEQAIKDNGRIVVSMDKRGEDYIIKITDNGKGISEKERERIFEPFFTTKPAGSGLGLSVVKSIVEEHGGKIDITSEPGSQTTVTIILPIQSNKAREPNDTKAQEQ